MRKLISVVALLSVALFATSPAQAQPRRIVNSNGDFSWFIRITSGDGAAGFVRGPNPTPIGTGSAHLTTGTQGDGSAEFRNTAFRGQRLANLRDLSYSTFVLSNNAQQFPYLILHVDTNGDLVAEDLLFFEPPFQSPGSGGPTCADQPATALTTWQTWEATLDDCWYGLDAVTFAPSFAGPGIATQPLSDYVALHPNARIVNPSGLGGIRLLVGFALPADRFVSYVDNFTLQFGFFSRTFDFEE
ncbi:hypothetical protein [Nonomuraea sp. 10N515B]|uniref:hypothetical protein n=1 Tax=Nonomuraea sp. 10N515B TaxID=3457422 RepID=UPI003FCD8821